MRSRTFPSLMLAAGLLCAPVLAQDPALDAPPPPPPTPAVVIQDDGAPSSMARGRDTLSVDFPDEEIRTILRNVADLFELNLVIPDTLMGRTSIKLRDVTWRQIFQVVLSPVGFTYVEEGNIIRVLSQDSLAMEPVTTEVFLINYATAADILPVLQPLVDAAAGGRVMVDARSNALVITERPSQFSRIRPIIEQLDTATAQVMIESKFVEVTNADVRNIGVNWASLAGMQVGVSNIGQTWDRSRGQTRTNENLTGIDSRSGGSTTTTSGSGTSTSTSQTNGLTNFSDTTTTTTNTGGFTTSQTTSSSGDLLTFHPDTGVPTVTPIPPITNTTTTTTAPSSRTDSQTLGGSGFNNSSSSTSLSDATHNIANTLFNESSNAVSNLLGLTSTGGTNRLASAVFSASDFNLIISALQTQNDTKLVSNPTIVTLNNTEAQINIGQEFPIPNYTYNTERGTYEVSGFDYRPVGIILQVTPQVNSQGFIKLTIEPEVSSTTEFANFGGAQIPIVTTRRTRTQVSLRDGYTMGIGGLIENRETMGQTKVPVLGSIPGLGRLFRSDAKSDQMRNLIIFITAKTVSPEGAPIEEVFHSDAVRQLQIKRSQLPGYRDGSDPFLPEGVNLR
jgi:type II secretory pathway component GspD/PulD (secretin)